MKTITYSASVVFVVFVACFAAEPATAQEETFTLQYRGPEKVSYFVERTFKWVRNRDEENAEIRHQRAIIKYGKSTILDTGVIRLTPQVHLLSEDGKWDKLRAALKPLKIRFPTGMWTDGWRWQVQVMARDHDMFPVFPDKGVKVGESWEIEGRFTFGRGYNVTAKIVHRLEGVEKMGPRRCAKIKYSFSATCDIAEHPELAIDEISRQIKPVYTLKGEGTAYFDLEMGFVVRQDHRVDQTHRWTGKLKAKEIPSHWRKQTDDIRSSRISVNLISEEEAARLIKEAEEHRGEPPKPEPAQEPPPQWRYYLERTIVRRDRIQETEKTWLDRAFMGYGPAKPRVTYVDESRTPMEEPRNVGPPIQPIKAEKLSLRDKLPEFGGPGSGLSWPVNIIAYSFDILPMMPEDELTPKKRWVTKIQMSFEGIPEATFTAAVNHSSNDYEQRKGRRCLKIEYTVSGEYRSADHPDRFSAEQLKEHRVEFSLSGEGVAYYDPEEGILVEKEQTVTWRSVYERLRRVKDGKLGNSGDIIVNPPQLRC